MKKRKKMMYLTSKNAGLCLVFFLSLKNKNECYSSSFCITEFDRYELQIYEEVAKMPPFQRKTLVLIGAQGVGRRSLKNRLVFINPLRYGTTVPCEYAARSTAATAVNKLTSFLTFHLQSRLASPGKRSETVRTTALLHGKRWKRTSRRAVTWSTESMTATFTAPRSTPSTRWWTPAAPASWTSTLRSVGRAHAA